MKSTSRQIGPKALVGDKGDGSGRKTGRGTWGETGDRTGGKTREEARGGTGKRLRGEAGVGTRGRSRKKAGGKTLGDGLLVTLENRWRGTKAEESTESTAVLVSKSIGLSTPLGSISRSTVSTLIGVYKREGLSNGTINRRLSALSTILDVSSKAGLCLPVDVTKGMMLKESKGRVRVVSPEELLELKRLMPLHAPLLHFLVMTGMRVQEALRLRRIDVDETRALVVDSKNGCSRRVPIAPGALNAAVWPHTCEPRVFQLTQGGLNRSWAAARKTLGLEADKSFVPHALRHTCATRLVASGMPLALVQRWLGHKSITMTMRYAHVDDSMVQEWVKKLPGWRSYEDLGDDVRNAQPTQQASGPAVEQV